MGPPGAALASSGTELEAGDFSTPGAWTYALHRAGGVSVTDPAVVTTPALFFDDGVYDDPFASEAWGWRAALKHLRPGGRGADASVDRVRKELTATLALDADGRPAPGEAPRADRIVRAALSATVPVLRARTGPVALNLQTRYDFTRQRGRTTRSTATRRTARRSG